MFDSHSRYHLYILNHRYTSGLSECYAKALFVGSNPTRWSRDVTFWQQVGVSHGLELPIWSIRKAVNPPVCQTGDDRGSTGIDRIAC